LRRCSPRSRSSAESTSAAVAVETSTCPPCPAVATRAARCTSAPTYPSSLSSGVPVWMPIRTESSSFCCASRAASSAPGAVGNATKKASPCVSTSTPPWRSKASRMTRRCSARCLPYSSAPSSCNSRVEPSMSVKRKVTVPVGRSVRMTRSSARRDPSSSHMRPQGLARLCPCRSGTGTRGLRPARLRPGFRDGGQQDTSRFGMPASRRPIER
jgi:hypothetical protein